MILKKRFVSLLLAFALMVSMVPYLGVTAFAAGYNGNAAASWALTHVSDDTYNKNVVGYNTCAAFIRGCLRSMGLTIAGEVSGYYTTYVGALRQAILNTGLFEQFVVTYRSSGYIYTGDSVSNQKLSLGDIIVFDQVDPCGIKDGNHIAIITEITSDGLVKITDANFSENYRRNNTYTWSGKTYNNSSYTASNSAYSTSKGTIVIHALHFTGGGNNQDTEPPIIYGIETFNESSDGFMICCYAGDNDEIDRVEFKIWTTANGQDDLKTHLGKQFENEFSYTLNISEHNYESGEYQIVAYVYDVSGNLSQSETIKVNVYGGTGNPQNPTTCSCSESYAGYYRAVCRPNLNVNSEHNWDSQINKSLAIPYGTIVYVSKASKPAGQSGGYAHVNYGGYNGIIATGYLEPAPSYTLDLNGWLDGVYNGGLSDYCTVDVYINDILVADDTGDFCREYPYGTKYEIKDIKATTGHIFQGYHIGSPSGTITGTTEVRLSLISDNQAPAISNPQITDISPYGYTVSCTVIDNAGVDKVQFPTWTAVEQDDLIWHDGVNPGNNVWTYNVNISEHGNDRGSYITHIYAWDKAGNVSSYHFDPVEVPQSEYIFDLNSLLDNNWCCELYDFGTVDVYIDGVKVADDVTDHYSAYPYGTYYEITDIKPTPGHVYNGAHTGNISGFITSDTEVILDISTQKFNLDLSGWLDGSYNGNTQGYGTADVYINGQLVADDCYDFYQAYPYGTAYEIKDIKAADGHVLLGNYTGDLGGIYSGMNGAALSGTITDTTVVCPIFNTDSTKPEMSGLTVTDLTPDGYTISCTATDDNGISVVEFGTWTEDDQSDLVWVNGSQNGNIWSAYVPVSEHSNKSGSYTTHIYATDNAGNQSMLGKIVTVPTSTYTVAYNANGGEGAPAVQTKNWGEALTLTGSVPTKNGFTFLGWAISQNAKVADYLSGASYTTDEDVTLYAVWEQSFDGIACGTFGDFTWELSNDHVLTVTGNGEIPQTVDETSPAWLNYADDIYKVVVGEGITIIGNSNFRNLTKLEEISLPDGLTRIRSRAFAGDIKLEQVVLPDTLTDMEAYVFQNCSSLEDIHLSSAQKYIGMYAFSGTALTKINIPASVDIPGYFNANGTYSGPFANTASLTEVVIEDGMETILEGMFGGMKALKTVHIPVSVKTVKEGAFNGCSALTDIYFDGTESQWNNAVTIETNNAYLNRATFHFAPETPMEETIEVAVTVPGASNAGISVTAPEGGWKEGENTFFVVCDKVCVAVVSYDGGVTYQRLTADSADGGAFYTVENMTTDTILTVSLAGDANSDGKLTNADVTRLQAITLKKVQPTPLQAVLLDVNKDGKLTNADKTRLRAVQLKKTQLGW